jgi:hypothetical protein
VIECLEQTVFLFRDLGVEHTYGSIVASAQQEIVSGRMEIQCSHLVIYFRVLPPLTVCPAVPGKSNQFSTLVFKEALRSALWHSTGPTRWTQQTRFQERRRRAEML